MKKIGGQIPHKSLLILGLLIVFSTLNPQQPTAEALTDPGPQTGSVGLEGTIPSPPPSRGATVAVPSSGTTVSSSPITISGLCPSGLLIKAFDNGIFVGSVICTNGSYSIPIDLFNGQNVLSTEDYDALNQSGPSSNSVNVTYNSAQFQQFGTQISLSSIYGELGASPGTELTWPIQLSGGTPPYALSIDWGDSSPDTLLSEVNGGTITLSHIYKSAGVYTVIVKATDSNGETAYLQLVGQATGVIVKTNSTTSAGSTAIKQEVAWWPAFAMLPLIFAAFWIGRRHELESLRKQFLDSK